MVMEKKWTKRRKKTGGKAKKENQKNNKGKGGSKKTYACERRGRIRRWRKIITVGKLMRKTMR